MILDSIEQREVCLRRGREYHTSYRQRTIVPEFLEQHLQTKLNAASGSQGIGSPAETWSFQEPDRNAVVGAIEQVECFGSKNQLRLFRERESLDDCRIGNEEITCAERVSRHSTVTTNRSEQTSSIGGS